MRYNVKRLRNLRIALKEAEPAFRNVLINGRPILESGRPYRNFGRMLPRELAANWLIAAVLDHCTRSNCFHIMSDPAGGDGLIFDTVTEQALWTEHVMVIERARAGAGLGDPQEKILKRVSEKNNRGRAYGRERHLIVFLYRSGKPGPWWPNRLARSLPRPFNFETVWLVSFQRFESADRIYAVTCLDVLQGHAPIWLVRIDSTFDRWAVCDYQVAGGPTNAVWAYNSGILASSQGAPIGVLRPAPAIRTPSVRQIAHFSRKKVT
jgi:hypothetical protein